MVAKGNYDGWQQCEEEIKPRLVMSLSGEGGDGKTHFSLTAPGDIGYYDYDLGSEGVVQKFQKVKKIFKKEPYFLDKSNYNSEAEVSKAARPVWRRFQDDYRYGLSHFRTLVVDTETEMYELARLAWFGKTEQVWPKTNYGPIFAEYRGLVREAFQSDASVIFLQKRKDEYVNDKRTGEKAPKGFSELRGPHGFLPQVICHTFMRDGKFVLKVEKCRLSPELVGMEMVQGEDFGTDDGFPILASRILGNEPEDWA